MNEENFPLMDDFSKIDVWASAMILINMLTLKFPYFDVIQDFDIYKNFIENPEKFFDDNQVEFETSEEKFEMCDLLKKMMVFEKSDRISIFDV